MDKSRTPDSCSQVQSLLNLSAKGLAVAAFPAELLEEGKLRFDDIEEVAVLIGDAITRKIVEHACQDRSDQIQQTDQVCCPQCHQPCHPKDPNPKIMLGKRGDVVWSEPAHRCPKCRRDFFPSGQRIGHRG